MTRANIYIHDTFIGEIGGDAYPDGDLWKMMMELHTNECTEKEFEDAVTRFVAERYGSEYLPPVSSGVGNWSYEYVWVATKNPGEYKDWKNWRGMILVRQPVFLHGAYWQVPGPWSQLSSTRRVLPNEGNGCTFTIEEVSNDNHKQPCRRRHG